MPPRPRRMKHVVSRDVVGSTCADGATAMSDKNWGFVCRVKKRGGPDLLLHCHTFVTKTLPGNLKNTLPFVGKIINGQGSGDQTASSVLSVEKWVLFTPSPFPYRGEMAFLMSNAQHSI